MNLAEFFKYLALGIIQGITEVLPISSSGHVELFKLILDLQAEEGVLFLILLNSGSLVAFLIFFRKDLAQMIRSFCRYLLKPETREENRKQFIYVLKLGLATLPAMIIGLIFEDAIDQLLIKYGGFLSGIGLMLTATVLLLISQRRLFLGQTEISYRDSLMIVAAQALAILPGVSRSGLTTSMGLKNGLGVDSTIRFSFLMYIPISLGSLALVVRKLFIEGSGVPGNEYYLYYFAAFSAALLFTCIAFKLVYPIFKTGKLKYFSFYCFLAGGLSIILSLA